MGDFFYVKLHNFVLFALNDEIDSRRFFKSLTPPPPSEKKNPDKPENYSSHDALWDVHRKYNVTMVSVS